jgi:hypothetical protein
VAIHLHYKGLFFVLTAAAGITMAFAAMGIMRHYIRDQLAADRSVWKQQWLQ